MDTPRLDRARRAHVITLRDLAQAERLAGDLATARVHALESLELADEHGHDDQAAASLHLLGKISLLQGDNARAVDELSRALAAAVDSQSFLIAAFCCEELGSLAVSEGDEELAAVMLAGAEDAFWSVPDLEESSRKRNVARISRERAELRQAS